MLLDAPCCEDMHAHAAADPLNDSGFEPSETDLDDDEDAMEASRVRRERGVRGGRRGDRHHVWLWSQLTQTSIFEFPFRRFFAGPGPELDQRLICRGCIRPRR